MGILGALFSSSSLKHLLTCTVYYSATTVEKIGLGRLHLPSQGDVKEPESCLSEALLTADLCVFPHLSCEAVRVCVCMCVGGQGCLFACKLLYLDVRVQEGL